MKMNYDCEFEQVSNSDSESESFHILLLNE